MFHTDGRSGVFYSGQGNPEYIDIYDIDAEGYEEPAGVLTQDDLDLFYDKHGFQVANGLGDATVMVYKWDGVADSFNELGITHAAKKKSCSCGAGRWIMYESKLGLWIRIEHVYDQLNDSENPEPTNARYGEPFRYYKPK